MDDNDQYAKLLSSIKPQNMRLKRPLSPIQTAVLIDRLINEEGQDIAESLLPIGKKIISDFLQLKNDLPEECHDAVTWGASDELGVGFSVAHFIATLEKHDEKLLLFNEASKKTIDAKDIQEIIRHYKKKDLTLEEVIQKVTDARPQILTTYLVVISISENSKKKLEEISKKSQKTSEESLDELIKKKFNLLEIDSIQMKGNNVAIALKEKEYREYKKLISKLGLDYDEITEYLVN